MKFGIRLLLLSFITLNSCRAVEAVNDKHKELSAVQTRVEQVDAELKEIAQEKNARQEQLKQLEKQYGELINSLQTLKSELSKQEQRLSDARRKINLVKQDMQWQQNSLMQLIKSAYAIGDHASFKLLLNQRDPAIAFRMPIYYDFISKARLNKLSALEEDMTALKQLEEQLHTESEALATMLQKKQTETDALQAVKSTREILVAQLEADYQTKQQEMVKLAHDQQRLANTILFLQKSDENVKIDRSHHIQQQPVAQQSPIESKPLTIIQEAAPNKSLKDLQGKLPWPVDGAISQHFGDHRYETNLDGALINAREGADIHAIAAGRIIYSDWLRGYGLMVIIDHNQGYMSLYAFNQSLRKQVGEQVQGGDIIGSVGRSGGRSQAALYFGIRKDGKPVNPETWCRKF